MFSELKCKACINLSRSHEQGAIKKVGGLDTARKMLEWLDYKRYSCLALVELTNHQKVHASLFGSEYSMYQIYVQLAMVAITVQQAHQYLTQVSLSSTPA